MRPSDIRSAHARIRAHIRRTPILEAASPIAGAPPLSLKLECLQATGSFKARGAFHNLLTRAAAESGCATASGGNHGARRRLRGPEARDPRARLRAGNRLARQNREDQSLRSGSGDWRRGLCRGPGAMRRVCRRERRPLDSSLRRSRDDRRPGHGGAGMGGGPRPNSGSRASTRFSLRWAAAG